MVKKAPREEKSPSDKDDEVPETLAMDADNDEVPDTLAYLPDSQPDPQMFVADLFAQNLEEMEVTIELEDDGLTEDDKRMIAIKDLMEFAQKTLVVIQSWQMPPLDRYTRDLIEGREQLEIDATLLLTSMTTCKDNPEEHFDMKTQIDRSVCIRNRFLDLKQLFTNYKDLNEQKDCKKDEAQGGSGGSSSKGQKRKEGS